MHHKLGCGQRRATTRGDGSRQGWTTEADYLDGQRVDLSGLADDLAAQPGNAILTPREAPGAPLLGDVWLEPVGETAWYLGMLSVHPTLQDSGYGRTLLQAAEDYARAKGATHMYLTVLNIRDALIAWYRRRGYAPTGEMRPFPYGDDRFGVPKRDDLALVVFEKALP